MKRSLGDPIQRADADHEPPTTVGQDSSRGQISIPLREQGSSPPSKIRRQASKLKLVSSAFKLLAVNGPSA